MPYRGEEEVLPLLLLSPVEWREDLILVSTTEHLKRRFVAGLVAALDAAGQRQTLWIVVDSHGRLARGRQLRHIVQRLLYGRRFEEGQT